MKSASHYVSLLAVTLVIGAIASPVKALEFEYSYPGQVETDARTISPMHQMNNGGWATPMTAPRIAEVINFATKSDKPDAADMAKIKKVAAMLKSPAYAGKHVVVSGYTDNVGKDAPNQRLSYHRALAVVHALVAQGVPAMMLTAQGFGNAEPVASNATAEGRAANRRVTFTVSCPAPM